MSPPSESRTDAGADCGALVGRAPAGAGTPMDPAVGARHQEAVRLIAESRHLPPDGRLSALRRVCELEEESLRGTLEHPSRGIVAETAARGALLGGDPGKAHRMVRLGLQGGPDEITKSFLLRLDALATTARELQRTGYAWEITEPLPGEEEDPDLFADFAGRRIVFRVDEDATSIDELRSSSHSLELVIPVLPDGPELLAHVSDWMQPRREIVRGRGLVEEFFYAAEPA